MFKAILAFIKAHAVATAITTTVVVSTVVATPIIINQVEKPKQEIENTQIIENIVDNTVSNNTEVNEILDENTQEENTVTENITKEDKQDVEKETVSKEEVKKENVINNKPTNENVSNTSKKEEIKETENKGTWVTVIPVDTEQGFCGFQYNSEMKKYRVLLDGGYGAEFTKAQAMSQPDVVAIIKSYKEMIDSSQKQLVSIHNRYEEYRAEAQKKIDERKNTITTYTNAVISGGGDLESETVKATLAEYNRDLQEAIDYKASFDKSEANESSMYEQRKQNAQSKLNAILNQFQ